MFPRYAMLCTVIITGNHSKCKKSEISKIDANVWNLTCHEKGKLTEYYVAQNVPERSSLVWSGHSRSGRYLSDRNKHIKKQAQL
jgi:hypothetical protein